MGNKRAERQGEAPFGTWRWTAVDGEAREGEERAGAGKEVGGKVDGRGDPAEVVEDDGVVLLGVP